MRLLLAASGLVITFIDPSEPGGLVGATHWLLALYTIYAGALHAAALTLPQSFGWVRRWAHWLDVCWYLALISLSGGTQSIFFTFLFFAILVASLRWGFATGMRVTVVSAVLFLVIGYVLRPVEPGFELNRYLLRPVFLLVIGYIISHRGGFEIMLKRRLELLRAIGTTSNPRFGVDRTIGVNIERLRLLYDADACLMVSEDRAGGAYNLRRADRTDPEGACRAQPIAASLGQRLLSPGPDLAFVFTSATRLLKRAGAWQWHVNLAGEPSGAQMELGLAEDLARFLETRSLVSVPVRYRGQPSGRLYLTSSRMAFRSWDVGFLLQVIDTISPVVENTRLVDQLASSAAAEERRRIALDIHDSVIQPYLGIQMGLGAVKAGLDAACKEVDPGAEALQQKVAAAGAALDRVIQMTEAGTEGLRDVVRSLREPGAREATLVSALRRFADRYADATGIATNVEVDDHLRINDRLAAEVFQMVEEGLSNIRRHTHSPSATVRLRSKNSTLLLRIENEVQAGAAQCPEFTPRSLAERAAALDGRARVEQLGDGVCSVVVSIPL